MKTIAFLVIIAIGSFLLAANAAEIPENKKEKKSLALWEFGNMINCETGKSRFSYNNYGCWCGAGGSGRTVDATDRCCQDHDRCYGRLVRRGICSNGAWWYTSYRRSGCSGCSWRNSGCGKHLCYCDRVAAKCFKRVLSSFNASYKGYRSTGRC